MWDQRREKGKGDYMILSFILLVFLGAIVAWIFESLWGANVELAKRLPKSACVRWWWMAVLVIVFLQFASGMLLLSLATFSLLAESHVILAERNPGNVRPSCVIRNIPSVLRSMIQKVQSLIR